MGAPGATAPNKLAGMPDARTGSAEATRLELAAFPCLIRLRAAVASAPTPNMIDGPDSPVAIGPGVATRRATAAARRGFSCLAGLGRAVRQVRSQYLTTCVTFLCFPVVDSCLRVGGNTYATCLVMASLLWTTRHYTEIRSLFGRLSRSNGRGRSCQLATWPTNGRFLAGLARKLEARHIPDGILDVAI